MISWITRNFIAKLVKTEIMQINRMRLEHLLLLTVTFVVLDLVSTFIALRIGLIEIGFLFKGSPFVYVIIGKIFFLFAIVAIYFSMLEKSKEANLNKIIYFIGGLNGGIFIANMVQIYYYISYYG